MVPVLFRAEWQLSLVPVTLSFQSLIGLGPRTEIFCPQRIRDEGYPNALIIPQVETFHDLPWAGGEEFRFGEFLCETHWLDYSHQEAHPRYVARKQVQKLEEMGIRLMSAFELEFAMKDATTGKPCFDGPDYMCNYSMKDFEPFFGYVDKMFLQTGVDIECFHAEHAPGQFEAVMKPAFGIKGADDCFQFKQGIKELASKRNFTVHFMAKPNPEEAGCGLHYNFSLWDIKTGKNVFSDVNGPDKLSEFARHWIAGITTHAASLTALCAPTVNCYRRFHLPFAPDIADWNIDDRTTSFRIKNLTPSSTYMENRLPSGLCNPYLVVAGTLAAGLDGVNRKLVCPEKGKEGVKPLPYNLNEAISALENDDAMKDLLGSEFIDWFSGVKRKVELEMFKDTDVSECDPAALLAEFEEYSKLC